MIIIPRIHPKDKRYVLELNEEHFKLFNNIVKNNPGLSSAEYVKLMNFYNFNVETIEYAFKLFNTYQNTFYDVCGPFTNSNGKWNIYKESNLHIDQNKISDENIKLREEIINLKNKLKLE